ncbi:MAG TPA: hypothetical protein VJP02_24525 [Candidatus Sulfotelmatobacter sp.]|nr:hypothetical protein [Candidatus Sulfotelmatobacter sp.]
MDSYARSQEQRKDHLRMTELRLVQIFGLMAGSVGLLGGLFLLDREPLFAVLGMLGAMAVMLGSLGKLCNDSREE